MRAILHVLGTAQLEGSSIASIVAAIASGLDPAEYQVHAWFLGPDGPLTKDLERAGATVRSIEWCRGARDPVGAFRFWREIQKHDFAIVHQHFGARSIRGLVRLSSRARILYHLHAHIAEPIAKGGVPTIVRGADATIAVSRSIALQVPALRPKVVYAGVSSSREPRAENMLSRTATVIGAACRLVPRKGIADLIQVMAVLGPEFPGLRLEIAGTGPQRNALEREANRLGLADQVRFLGWQRNFRSQLRGWDIFATPTLDEGLCVAALEAMAEGLPVVATSVGGLPEIIEDGRTGFLVPPSDIAAFTGRLRLLILDSERRKAMGAAGRERVRDQFSACQMVAEIAAIYDSLSRPKPRAA